MKPTFEHSVDVLIKAYFNDTLIHTHNYCCAVGNIIADACNYTYKIEQKVHYPLESIHVSWQEAASDWMSWWPKELIVKTCSQQEATGYSAKELSLIEIAFEDRGNPSKDLIRSLGRVIDVLAKIHNIDLSIVDSTKEKYLKELLNG